MVLKLLPVLSRDEKNWYCFSLGQAPPAKDNNTKKVIVFLSPISLEFLFII